VSAIAAAPVAISYPAKAVRIMIAVSVSLSALLQVIDTSIVNVALTNMQATLGATLTEIGWVITAYGIASVIMIPLTAWCGGVFGKKRYFIFSVIGFTVASMLCGMATSLPMLIVARILQGLAGGGLLANAQAFLFENFPPEEQGGAQAIFGICVIAGPAIGPTLGGWLVDTYSWPWIFFVNLPVGILATFLCFTFLPKDEARPSAVKVDYFGIGLLIAWVGSLQTFLEQGNDEGWFESSYICWLAALFGVSFLVWIWHELRIKIPAVDIRVLRHKTLAAGSIFSFVLGIGLYGALFAVPVFAQQILGYTAFQTGMLLLPGAIASAIMMPVTGWLIKRFDARLLIAAGSAVIILSLLLLSKISTATGPDDLYWPLVLRGVGSVGIFLPLSVAVFSGVPRSDISSASGFFNLTRTLGGSVGIAILTTMLAQRHVFHREILAESVSHFVRPAQSQLQGLTRFFAGHGADPAHAYQQALSAINRKVDVQASVLSFADSFYFVAVLFGLCLLLLRFLGGSRSSDGAAPVHMD